MKGYSPETQSISYMPPITNSEKRKSINSRNCRLAKAISLTDSKTLPQTAEFLYSNYQFIQSYQLPKFLPAQSSSCSKGNIYAFAVNSTQGISRLTNEERVSIVLALKKDSHRAIDYWPQAYFFGIFDGHAGTGCCSFLRDNLHKYISQCEYFPSDPRKALYSSILRAEAVFLKQSEDERQDKSGSCALVALIVGITLNR